MTDNDGETAVGGTPPLTSLTRRSHNFWHLLEGARLEYRCRSWNRRQEAGTQLVRETIEKRRARFLCHRLERARAVRVVRERRGRDFAETHGLSSAAAGGRLAERTDGWRRRREEDDAIRRDRTIAIVDKLLREERRRRQIERRDVPGTSVGVPCPRSMPCKCTPDVPSFDESSGGKSDVDDADSPLGEPFKFETPLPMESFAEGEKDKKKKSKAQKKKSKAQKKKSKAQKKEAKTTKKIEHSTQKKSGPRDKQKKKKKGAHKPKRKKDKKDKEKTFASAVFALPLIPDANPREKITATDDAEMRKLPEEMAACERMVASHRRFREAEYRRVRAPSDSAFSWRPETVVFDVSEPGMMYRQKVTVVNGAGETRRCRFGRALNDDPFLDGAVQVEPANAQRLAPGMSLTFDVRFCPPPEAAVEGITPTGMRGTLAFVTDGGEEFEVPYRCSPPGPLVTCSPEMITFPPVPYWLMTAAGRRATVRLRNDGTRACVLAVRLRPPVAPGGDDRRATSDEAYGDTGVDIARAMIADCESRVFEPFAFDSYLVELPPMSRGRLGVVFRNASYVGAYASNYDLVVLEAAGIGKPWREREAKRLFLRAELTGRYLRPAVECLDFDACPPDSATQRAFTVTNEASFPCKMGFQFPTGLRDHLSVHPATAYVRAGHGHEFCLKFVPSVELLSRGGATDGGIGVLEFPLRVRPLQADAQRVPASEIRVFAILFGRSAVTLSPAEVDVGRVHTQETVTCNLVARNTTPVKQQYGFLDLPESVTVEPDYGFGTLAAGEERRLTVRLSPSAQDAHTNSNKGMTFELRCTTLTDAGGLRDDELKKFQIIKSMETRRSLKALNGETANEETTCDSRPADEIEVDERTTTSVLRARIVDNLCELSHQRVVFPDTPIGSHSVTAVHVHAFNSFSTGECVCGWHGRLRHGASPATVHFEIVGGDGAGEIRAQPTCGDLQYGARRRVTLVAQPELDTEVMRERVELCRARRVKETVGSGRARDRKRKGGTKGATDKSAADDPVVDLDRYRAERELLRSIDPRSVTADFTVVITFPGRPDLEQETFRLSVECRVVRPHFLLDAGSQPVDFGVTCIGTRRRRVVRLENIADVEIRAKMSATCPCGPFSLSAPPAWTSVGREHVLRIVLTMSPTSERTSTEHLEARCGGTTARFVARGEGVPADIDVQPTFVVCRLVAKRGERADCALTIVNRSRAAAAVRAVLQFELRGVVKPAPRDPSQKVKAKDKGKTKAKSNKTKSNKAKSNKAKSKKKSKGKSDSKQKKLSPELTADELHSLNVGLFVPSPAPSRFSVPTGENGCVQVPPTSKAFLKVRFETPVDADATKASKGRRRNKDKPAKGVKRATRSATRDDFTYVAKYNVMLDESVLLKDFLIIGRFIK